MSGSQEKALQYQRDQLMQFVAGKVRDNAVREDVVQETFLRLVAYGRDHVIDNWVALARRVAGNLVKDHFRARYRHPTEAIDEGMACSHPLQEQVLMHRQRLALFQRVLSDMPPLRREVLVRRRLHGESYEMIGAALALSPQAVEKHMTRALRQLHEALNAENTEERTGKSVS